jgi:pyruvate/2-oxoglutarate dehydrogenase complex dihydrolipoamide dehydrogenase (E3) component
MTALAKGEGTYNVVVIGAGTAGLVSAAGTAGLGGRVALIERNKMGGDCLNFGCVPSKALISSARLIDKINRAQDWGLGKMEPKFDFNEVLSRMRARRAQIAPNDSQERFESLGVDVFRGEARFVSPHEIEIETSPSPQSSPPGRGGRAAAGEGGRRLRARNFVIATGSRATIPKINGIDSVPYFTNETVFDKLDFKPASMIVLGGGPIGCELGQTFSRLGVQVTIAQRRDRLLPREDRDVSEFLEKRFKDEGISVLTNCQVQSTRRVDEKIDMKISQQNVETNISAEALLICIGRQPNIENLNLDSIGVKADKGGVKTNEYLQTSQPHIYAAGDIVGPFLFTHMADAHARVVVRNILMPFQFLRQQIDYSVVPWCTYVDPEIATVGLNETAAKDKNIEYDLIVQKLSEVDRAVVENEESGFVKVLAAKGTDKILGATLVCESAGDLLHEFVLAMKCGIGLGTISSTIHAYPTLAELARKVGDKYNKTRLTPIARKIFGWLYARQVA